MGRESVLGLPSFIHSVNRDVMISSFIMAVPLPLSKEAFPNPSAPGCPVSDTTHPGGVCIWVFAVTILKGCPSRLALIHLQGFSLSCFHTWTSFSTHTEWACSVRCQPGHPESSRSGFESLASPIPSSFLNVPICRIGTLIVPTA